MGAWIWHKLPYGRPGKLIGSVLATAHRRPGAGAPEVLGCTVPSAAFS
jgi:hypothetical protein